MASLKGLSVPLINEEWVDGFVHPLFVRQEAEGPSVLKIRRWRSTQYREAWRSSLGAREIHDVQQETLGCRIWHRARVDHDVMDNDQIRTGGAHSEMPDFIRCVFNRCAGPGHPLHFDMLLFRPTLLAAHQIKGFPRGLMSFQPRDFICWVASASVILNGLPKHRILRMARTALFGNIVEFTGFRHRNGVGQVGNQVTYAKSQRGEKLAWIATGNSSVTRGYRPSHAVCANRSEWSRGVG